MGRWGSLVFGFCAGSALTAAAAYLMVARDLERLQKEKKRLEQGQDDGLTTLSRGVSTRSAAAVVAASGEHVGFLTGTWLVGSVVS